MCILYPTCPDTSGQYQPTQEYFPTEHVGRHDSWSSPDHFYLHSTFLSYLATLRPWVWILWSCKMICIRLIKCYTQCSVPSDGNQAGSSFIFFIFTPFWSKHNWEIKCISQVVYKNICDAVVVVCTENDLHSRYLDHLSPKKIAFLYVRWEYLRSVAKFQAEESIVSVLYFGSQKSFII